MSSKPVIETPGQLTPEVDKEEKKEENGKKAGEKEEKKGDETSSKSPSMDPKVREEIDTYLEELNSLVDVHSIEPTSEGDLLDLFFKFFSCRPGTQEWADSMKALLGRVIGPHDPRYSRENLAATLVARRGQEDWKLFDESKE